MESSFIEDALGAQLRLLHSPHHQPAATPVLITCPAVISLMLQIESM